MTKLSGWLRHWHWCFTPTNVQISLSRVVRPKQLDFFAQNNLRVRIFVWCKNQPVRRKKRAKTMIPKYHSIIKWGLKRNLQIYFRLHLSTPDELSSPSTDQWFPVYGKHDRPKLNAFLVTWPSSLFILACRAKEDNTHVGNPTCKDAKYKHACHCLLCSHVT